MLITKYSALAACLTGSDGRVRTLTANGRTEKVNGRDVRTMWDKQRLVSEISVGNAEVIDTYERPRENCGDQRGRHSGGDRLARHLLTVLRH